MQSQYLERRQAFLERRKSSQQHARREGNLNSPSAPALHAPSKTTTTPATQGVSRKASYYYTLAAYLATKLNAFIIFVFNVLLSLKSTLLETISMARCYLQHGYCRLQTALAACSRYLLFTLHSSALEVQHTLQCTWHTCSIQLSAFYTLCYSHGCKQHIHHLLLTVTSTCSRFFSILSAIVCAQFSCHLALSLIMRVTAGICWLFSISSVALTACIFVMLYHCVYLSTFALAITLKSYILPLNTHNTKETVLTYEQGFTSTCKRVLFQSLGLSLFFGLPQAILLPLSFECFTRTLIRLSPKLLHTDGYHGYHSVFYPSSILQLRRLYSLPCPWPSPSSTLLPKSKQLQGLELCKTFDAHIAKRYEDLHHHTLALDPITLTLPLVFCCNGSTQPPTELDGNMNELRDFSTTYGTDYYGNCLSPKHITIDTKRNEAVSELITKKWPLWSQSYKHKLNDVLGPLHSFYQRLPHCLRQQYQACL